MNNTKINLLNFPLFLLLLSIFSLFCAYIVEHIMHLLACPLCIYQRFPYLIFIFISIVYLNNPRWKYFYQYFIVVALSAIILAVYHSGVERGVFEMSAVCKPLVPAFDNLSLQEIKKMIYNVPIAKCNKPALVIFSLSMTEWNIVANALLIILMTLSRWLKITKNL